MSKRVQFDICVDRSQVALEKGARIVIGENKPGMIVCGKCFSEKHLRPEWNGKGIKGWKCSNCKHKFSQDEKAIVTFAK